MKRIKNPDLIARQDPAKRLQSDWQSGELRSLHHRERCASRSLLDLSTQSEARLLGDPKEAPGKRLAGRAGYNAARPTNRWRLDMQSSTSKSPSEAIRGI
jgi:hypothetical protein